MAEKIILSDRTHPLYDANTDLWELYANAAKGGESFITDANLFSHRLEDAADYQQRLDRGFYLNFCDAVPTIYNSYIFKSAIERKPDIDLDIFRRNVDGRGTDISDFIKKVGYLASVYGVIHVLVDMPTSANTVNTVASAKATDLYPYCTIIYPHQLKDWSLDAQGNFKWVVIETTYFRDDDPTIEREDETHFKLITKEEWKIEDEDGNPAKLEEGEENSGTHDFGMVPLITMYHKIGDDKIGESLLKDIVYVNRAIMNYSSLIDEMCERQTFSQLIVPDMGDLAEESETGTDPLSRIGTSSAWTFNAEAKNPPQFISPNTDNINTIWQLSQDLIKEIYRLSGLQGGTSDLYTSRSGRQSQMSFNGVNSALAEKASNYEKFENNISRVAYLMLGKSIDEYTDISYPSSFDIAALEEEIDNSMKIMERNFSETLNKSLQKQISRKALPTVPNDVKETIESEIDAGDGQVQPVTKMNTESNGDGNPNSELGDSFKSKSKADAEAKGKQAKE